MKTRFQPLRVGIIGCGGYAHQLIVRMRTLPRHIQLVAATSRNPNSEAALFWSDAGVKVVRTLDQLLDIAPGNLDVVLNPTPINVHYQSTLSCLEAGLPVWLEKPPVPTLAELDDLVAAAAKSGLSIDVCFNSIYGQNIQRLKKELVAGRYGKVRRIRGIAGCIRDLAYFQRNDWAGKLKLGDNWIFDGTINNPLAHLVCNNLYFASNDPHALAEVKAVQAHLWHGNAIESEDTSALRIETTDGIEVISNMTLCPEEIIPPSTVIDAEKATLTLADFETVKIDWHDGRSEFRPSFKENRIEMLEELSIRAQGDEPALCSLTMCRPFVQTVENAFHQVLERSGGVIPALPSTCLETVPNGDSTATKIRGINAEMQAAHQECRLMNPRVL